MRDIGGPDNLAVAMRTPNGDFEEPIRNHRLYWSIPGNINAVAELVGWLDRGGGVYRAAKCGSVHVAYLVTLVYKTTIIIMIMIIIITITIMNTE